MDGEQQRYCWENFAESNCDYLHKHHIYFFYNQQKKTPTQTTHSWKVRFCLKASKPLENNMLRTHKHFSLMIAPDMFYLAWSEERCWSYLRFLHMPQTQAKSSERAHVDRRGSSPPREPGATGLFTSTEKPCTCLWSFFSFSLKFPNLNMTLLSGVQAGLPAICCF